MATHIEQDNHIDAFLSYPNPNTEHLNRLAEMNRSRGGFNARSYLDLLLIMCF